MQQVTDIDLVQRQLVNHSNAVGADIICIWVGMPDQWLMFDDNHNI